MTQFVVGKPVTTDVPSVVVDAGLPVGRHRFRLTVIDTAGNESRPNEAVVQVVPLTVVVPGQPVTPVVLNPAGPVIAPHVVGPIVTPNLTGPVVTPVRAATPTPPSKPPSKPRKKR